MDKSQENKIDGDEVVRRLLQSTTKVCVSSTKGKEEKTIKQIIKEANDKCEGVVFTFTPEPFKSLGELPPGWMEKAAGCSIQLRHLNESGMKVYAVNTQDCDYQCGSNGLLAAKQWENLWMIDDSTRGFQKELGLTPLKIDGVDYFERFSVGINIKGEGRYFPITSPVNDVKAAQHTGDLKTFVVPEQEYVWVYSV